MLKPLMKKLCPRFIKLTLLSILFLSGLFYSVQASELKLNSSIDIVTAHIWRGFNFSDSLSSQPSLKAEWVNVGLKYWGSFSWEDENYSEHQLSCQYVFRNWFPSSDMILGYTYYQYPSRDSGKSHEFFLSFQWDKLIFQPTFTLFMDVGEEDDGGGDGEYFQISFFEDFELEPKLFLETGLSLGYNNKLHVDENGVADFHPRVALRWNRSNHFQFSLGIEYSRIIDSDLEDAMGTADEWMGKCSFRFYM